MPEFRCSFVFGFVSCTHPKIPINNLTKLGEKKIIEVREPSEFYSDNTQWDLVWERSHYDMKNFAWALTIKNSCGGSDSKSGSQHTMKLLSKLYENQKINKTYPAAKA